MDVGRGDAALNVSNSQQWKHISAEKDALSALFFRRAAVRRAPDNGHQHAAVEQALGHALDVVEA